METKQTAVEWLVEKLIKGEFINNTDELIEQAKQMENEQMFYSFEAGYDKGHNSNDWVNNVPKMKSLYEDSKKKGHII